MLFGYFRRYRLNMHSIRVLYFSFTFTFDRFQIRKRISEKLWLLVEFGWPIYHTNRVILCSQIVKNKLQIIREIIHNRKSWLMNFLKSVKRQSFNRSQRKKARNGLYGHVYGPYESLPDNIFRYETLYAPNGKHFSQSKTPTVFFRKKSGRMKR